MGTVKTLACFTYAEATLESTERGISLYLSYKDGISTPKVCIASVVLTPQGFLVDYPRDPIKVFYQWDNEQGGTDPRVYKHRTLWEHNTNTKASLAPKDFNLGKWTLEYVGKAIELACSLSLAISEIQQAVTEQQDKATKERKERLQVLETLNIMLFGSDGAKV